MKRYWFLILLAGCTAPAPEVAPSKPPTDGTAEVAAAVASLESKRAPTPKAPQKPGDPCDNCKGTGKVGDGTVMVDCKPCKGTGKVLAPEQPKATAPPKPRDITTEPTASLLKEWNTWRHNDEPRTRYIQTIYEELVRREVISRNGEPREEYGGRRRRHRR